MNEEQPKDTEMQNRPGTELIVGRNAVLEALRGARELDTLYVQAGDRQGQLRMIVALAREKQVLVKQTAKEHLDRMSGTANHQGVAASVAAYRYADLEEILEKAKHSGQPPFLVLCDEIEDPHNLGAIIRTAEAAGAHGIVIPKRRAVGLTAAVAKAASGALEYLPVARVSNLAAAIETLKSKNIFVYAADLDGKPYKECRFSGGVALVIGSEGTGVRRLTKKKCDEIVTLPMYGQTQSLNASVACGILLYEIACQRGG